MKKHVFRIGLVVTMLLGLMMISANAADAPTCPHGDGAAHGDGWIAVTAEDVAAWGGTTLASGKYYLTESAEISSEVTISSDVSICLNGKTLTFTHAASTAVNAFHLDKTADITVEIFDCLGGGTITANTTSYTKKIYLFDVTKKATINFWNGSVTKFYGNYGVIRLNASGSVLNMYGGDFTTNGTMYCGLVTIQNGTFNMYGGSIVDCTVGNASSGGGGVVNVGYTGSNACTFNMYGGTIKNSKNGRLNAAGVVVFNTASAFNMESGTIDITSTTAPNAVASIGTVTITDGTIKSASGSAIVDIVYSKASTQKAGTGTYTITGGTFSEDVSDYITDKETYTCVPNDDGTYTVKDKSSVDTSDLGTEIHGVGNGYWLPYTPGTTQLETGKNYYLTAADTDVAQIVIPEDATIGFCLHGYDLTSAATDNAFVVNAGATLNLCPDCTEATVGTITGADGSRAIQINGGTVNMGGGTISGFDGGSEDLGGAVYVASAGTFTMTGGTITGNTATQGGAIYATGKSTVNVKGGTISNNTASSTSYGSYHGGGAIWCNGGYVNLSSGEITGNSAGWGSAARVNGGCVLTVSGDVKIHGNYSERSGALCAYYSGTISMTGGSIYNNAANKSSTDCYGAAIALSTGSTKATISGGSIGLDPSGNPAANYSVVNGGDFVTGDKRDSRGSILCAYNTSGASTVTGGTFYANEGDTLFGSFASGYWTDTGAAQVTGGSFSGALDSRNLPEDYHDYLLSAPADENLPIMVAKTFKPSSMKLVLQNGANGLVMQVNYTNLPAGTVKADYEIECLGGSLVYEWSSQCGCAIAAKDMGKDVTVNFKNNGGIAGTATFSIKEYATDLLAASSSSDELKAAMSDLLRYGAAAQTYFETGDTAVTDGVTLESGSEWTPENNCNLEADTTELYKGSALSLKNKINMNLYFDSSVTAVKVGGNSVVLTLDENSGYKVASVTSGLNLANATEQVAIEITVGENDPITVYDSIEAYAFRTTKLATENEALTDLCQKMMNFVTSAQAYFATL